MELLEKIVKFGLVGIIGMGIDFGLTWLFKEKFRVNKYAANTIGFSAAVINNFILNYFWTFNSTGKNPQLFFIKFLVFALIGLGLNNLIIYLLNEKLSLKFYLAKFLAIGLVFLWNFSTNNYLNF
ncbi:MAG: GtrA family protein [Pyrinomonadaceae bacterium]|nr:GtrA family protein [Sphingobacteriaceae bacterium]